MKTRDKLLLCSAVAGMMAAAPAAQAADKITLMVGGYEKIIYLPAKLAEGLGYFKEEGLNVELLNEGAGVDAENEMLAGAVQGVVGFYDHCVDLQSKGKYIESVVQLAHAPGEVELVSSKLPQVKSMADLKGKTMGVTGLGSSTNFLTQYLMVKAGVPIGRFTSLPVGAGTIPRSRVCSRPAKHASWSTCVRQRRPRKHSAAPIRPPRSICRRTGSRRTSPPCRNSPTPS
jgi:NitT/TauT family transport system substrate-binding protein